MSDPLVLAEVNVITDGEVSKLGTHKFTCLPRLGETVVIGNQPMDIWLKVREVMHFPMVSEDQVAVVVLTCEIYV